MGDTVCLHCGVFTPLQDMIIVSIEGRGVNFEPNIELRQLGLFGGAADCMCRHCYSSGKEAERVVRRLDDYSLEYVGFEQTEVLERVHFCKEDAPICGYCLKGAKEDDGLVHTVHVLLKETYHLRIHKSCIKTLRGKGLVRDTKSGGRMYKLWEILDETVLDIFAN